ncbi:Gfo/Idh/MocA family protein [Metabacillus rhizolycopersici]|uniref:Gfo/Idh/MocA family oxidoreductase n=1 Tax=Metabacillus rhizolycopersici TaxID=2875709 RepID=A0ABS7UV53_9BACI|nr:Gfo/Idh/MocA family oxidoreductase [Metabacillus rhizolycopersici]MBZ5751825.1 Gfo/Idh/MocA family oxidoreductase [Metabacillus rhizolycopersici]
MSIEKKKVRVGMIGYKFMGKAHSLAYRNLPFFFDTKFVPVMQAISGRNEAGVKKAAEKMGWDSYETDWRKLIQRDDIDVIDIVTPNSTHFEMAIAAAEAGKHIICEKPLSMNVNQAKRMYEAVQKNGVIHMICHNYRFAPAVQYAKKLIDQGRLGNIRHIRGTYLQDASMDPNLPITWRAKKEITGSGALGDIGSHSLDLARFLVGEFQEVVGVMETFIKQRPIQNEGLNVQVDATKMGEVTVDDATVILARFENGAIGTFEATKFAGGNLNGNRFEINGDKGSIRWDLENLNNLDVYFADDEPGLRGFRTINCTEEIHPYAGAYWPPAHIIGYEHTFINLLSDFMNGIADGISPKPNFEDGLRNQIVLESIEKSAMQKSWVNISEISNNSLVTNLK